MPSVRSSSRISGPVRRCRSLVTCPASWLATVPPGAPPAATVSFASAMRSAYARCTTVTNYSERAGDSELFRRRAREGSAVIGEQESVVTVVVDVANVMGARADGWWRDRAGAALRLCEQVVALADRGVPEALMPGGLPVPERWVLVLEGRSRAAAADAVTAASAARAQVSVVTAPNSGDDEIVAEVVSLGGACLVVTADRELRRRCEAAGATVTGPGWLLRQL
jgi:hypothetical protein